MIYIISQTQPRELHVYYHRNTPEPPSAEEGDGDEESGDNDAAVESMEMDFPSGYTDEVIEVYVS